LQVDYAIEVDQCYGQKNLTLCYENPSPLKITNVVFKNFQGTTSTKYEPDIATFACSSDAACSNIRASNINVQGPGGSLAYCHNVDESTLVGVDCTGPYKGFE
jgi:galacturan 1,4-alpha-galacturonidase